MLAITILLCVFSAAPLHAKEQKTSYTFLEISFVLRVLDTLELKGNEVGAFIEIRDKFVNKFEELNKKEAKPDDSELLKLDDAQTRNFLLFLQRAQLKGADATMFNDIVQKTIASASKTTR